MNHYERKQEAKRQRLEAAADRAEARAQAAYKRADMREEVSGIPMGQPILVGHHSEARHRAALRRADNAMRKSIEEDKLAGELRARAAAVGSGGISSDDPDALGKLERKLAKLEEFQRVMREANKAIRKAIKADVQDAESEGWADYLAAMQAIAPVFDASQAAELLKPDFAGRIGFADYQLSNNSAEIRRLKARIASLEKAAEAETVEVELQGLCKMVENAEENRVQFLFDGKPAAEVRSILKRHGFRWAPSQGAWQRHLNTNGRYAAKRVIEALS